MVDVTESKNSGSYHIGPVNETGNPTAELETVQSNIRDLALEEFPEGPYGAATNEEKLGKASPWKPGQQSIGRYRDTNPVSSDRMVVKEEPKTDAPIGSIEGQN